jgi:tRNA pseudouridine38-40 synthase
MNKFHYLLELQFLGFRLHGWQKQSTTHRTIQGMLERTLITVLEHENFKTLGASRTDSMVSSLSSLCKLTIKDSDIDPDELKEKLNANLPADIKVKSLSRTTEELRIINDPKVKEYHYYFCNDEDASPLIAPFMCNYNEELNLETMQKAAKLFEGEHNFKNFCYRAHETPNKVFKRSVDFCEVKVNDILTANFFPEKSYVFIVKGQGFMRHQVRMMMAAVIMTGSGEISVDQLADSLKGNTIPFKIFVAPASGLQLFKTEFI